MKVEVTEYDPVKGKGKMKVDGKTVNFTYHVFAAEMFLGKGELIAGKLVRIPGLVEKIMLWIKGVNNAYRRN